MTAWSPCGSDGVESTSVCPSDEKSLTNSFATSIADFARGAFIVYKGEVGMSRGGLIAAAARDINFAGGGAGGSGDGEALRFYV